jgi:hypothetical protein
VPVVVVAGLVVLVVGLLVDRRRAARQQGGSVIGLVPALVLALPLAVLAVRGVFKPDGAFDAFTNWGLKGKLLYYSGAFFIDHRIFDPMFATNSTGPPVERVYPIGLPSLEAYFIHAMSGPDFRVLHLLFVALLASFALTVFGLLRPLIGPWALVAGLSAVLWMPAARDQALSENADVALACFWVTAVLFAGLWLRRDDTSFLALTALFAAAALATKREGTIYAAILWGLMLVAVLVASKRERVRPLVLAGLFIALSALPWRIFVTVHGLTGHDISVSPTRISEHRGELPMIVRELGRLLVDPAFLIVVPLAAAAAILLVLLGRDRRLAGAFLLLVGGVLFTLIVVYVNSRPDTRYLLRTTARRTLMTPALLSATLLPLLLSRLFRVPEER